VAASTTESAQELKIPSIDAFIYSFIYVFIKPRAGRGGGAVFRA
jgi:hypothetical protein